MTCFARSLALPGNEHRQVHTISLGAARPTDFDEHLQVLPLLDRVHLTFGI